MAEQKTNYFIHESSYIDDNVKIGSGTKVWHFCHILSGTKIGKNCSFGQNVMAGPDVIIGDGCKIQNNVSVYEGVELEDSDFFLGLDLDDFDFDLETEKERQLPISYLPEHLQSAARHFINVPSSKSLLLSELRDNRAALQKKYALKLHPQTPLLHA